MNRLFLWTFVPKCIDMFVQSNTIRAAKLYFKERLEGLFSATEIKFIANQSIALRLNMTTSEVLLADEHRLSESDLLFLRSVVKRLQANEPLQYIFGDTLFYDLTIKCDSRALIPRPETEELVDWIVSDFQQKIVERIVDVCTGSGCIAFALKSKFPIAHVVGIDWSKDALTLADENKNKLQLEVDMLHMNALEKWDAHVFQPNSVDILVSNPPYITASEKKGMHPNVLEFEPEMALFVPNDDPLLFYRAIAENSLYVLKSGGSLYFELNENFASETKQLLVDLGFVHTEIREDLQGKKRMLKAQKQH